MRTFTSRGPGSSTKSTNRRWRCKMRKTRRASIQKSAGAYAECSYALTKLGRAEEALQQIKRATELDANFATAWQYRGELEMERGETLSAIESLTHAIETNQTVTALQKREKCYRRLGLLVKAEQDHRTLEELNAQTPK